MQIKPLMTPKEVAEILNCKQSSVYAWAKEGKIPAFKINGLLRFDLLEVREWIGNHRISPLDADKKAKKIIKPSKNVDIDRVVRRAIDTYAGSGISSYQGETRSNQARKGGH